MLPRKAVATSKLASLLGLSGSCTVFKGIDTWLLAMDFSAYDCMTERYFLAESGMAKNMVQSRARKGEEFAIVLYQKCR